MSDAERLARRMHHLSLLGRGYSEAEIAHRKWGFAELDPEARELYLYVADRLLAEYEPKRDAPAAAGK